MATLLNIALINSVTVLPLAVLAFVVSRVARRAALTHALWVLVLLKFVTPPLFHLPVTIETPAAIETRSAEVGHVSNVSVPRSDSVRLENSLATIDSATRAGSSSANVPPLAKAESRHVGRDATSFVTSTLKTCSMYWVRRPELQSLLFGCWLAGTVLWMTLQIVRAVRFQRRVLRDTIAPVELQEQTQQLATRLGLRQAPQVLIVDAAASPMLWLASQVAVSIGSCRSTQ